LAASVTILLMAAACACLGAGPAAALEALPVLARIGPWPAVSNLVGYGERLWLVNSVRFQKHNSADVYSYDPATGEVRYERQLFSQSAGQPMVDRGLLYWPFEDARASLGFGHFMVTDGERWRLETIASPPIFHIRAMAAPGGRLVAATSARQAALHASGDQGASWQRVYEHATPVGQTSGIAEVATRVPFTFGYLSSQEQQRLLRFDGERVEPVPGWPSGLPVLALAAWREQVWGLVWEGDGISLWRTDGEQSARAIPIQARWPARDLAAGGDGLWALTATPSGGELWLTTDGTSWERQATLAGGRPHELVAWQDAVFVGGLGRDGRGVLWGPSAWRPLPDGVPGDLAMPAPPDGKANDWDAAGAALDQALADPDSYDERGRVLRDLVWELALLQPPAGFFAARLSSRFPDRALPLIDDQTVIPAAKLARWILLWGMAVAGGGEVPKALLEEPWRAPANSSHKYFEAAPAAMWAAGVIGQDDPGTIETLLARLERPDDPLWLKGDAVGALSALTGQRFAYDAAAWRAWWRSAAPPR